LQRNPQRSNDDRMKHPKVRKCSGSLGTNQRKLTGETRIKIQAFHNRDPDAKGKPISADDNPELMHVALESRALREIAVNIEREIQEGLQ
jgi:hypothetical protein